MSVAIEAFHGTLTANVVTTVTTTAYHPAVEVMNVDGAAIIYATFDGSVPTVGGGAQLCIPAATGSAVVKFNLPWPVPTDTTVVIKMISAGTPTYHVAGVDA